MENLYDKRKVYEKSQLLENQIKENPIEMFRDWFLEAEENPAVSESNAMAVSTVEADGCPRTRMVLLKAYNWEGFVFYTNYESQKALAMQENPKVCISFHWSRTERQIIINGEIEKLPENLSDGYFESRPRGSQLGAWASEQSKTIASREEMDQKLADFEKQFEGKEIPRPIYWGGYLVKPTRIEFWQGRPDHQRS